MSHLSGQNGPYDAYATLTISLGFLNLTHGTVCLGSGRPGSTPPSSRNHRRFPGEDTDPVNALGSLHLDSGEMVNCAQTSETHRD